MTDIVKGMVKAFYGINQNVDPPHKWFEHSDGQMRAALLWLADNVSKEMSVAFWNEFYREYRTGGQAETVNALAAAIRAAGEEGK